MSDKSDTTESNPSYKELVENILSQLEIFLSGQIKELFDKTDDFLFNSADHASSIDEQNRLFEFMNGLRVQKDEIEETFVKEFNIYLKPISENKALPSKKRRGDENVLGLIDQDEMDEMVAITTISSKAQMDNQEAISHLEARLEHLGLQTQHIFLPKALEPINFCHAFQEALSETEFSTRDKLILHKMFGQEVTGHLHELYKTLNELMIEEGVLPQIELSGKIKKTEEPPMPQHGGDELPEGGGEEAGNQPQVSGYGLAGRTGGGYGGSAGAGASGMAGGGTGTGGPGMAGGGTGAGGPGMAGGGAGAGGSGMAGGGTGAGGPGMAGGGTGAGGPGMAGGGAGAGSSGMSGGVAGAGGSGMAGGVGAGTGGSGMAGGGGAGGSGAAASGTAENAADSSTASGGGGMVAGYPASEVRESIESFVGGAPGDAGAGGGGGAYYSHQDTLGALSSMQSSARIDPNASLEFNASAIKKAVLTTIGEKEGGAVTKPINQVSEKTIDFIKLIFDAIIEDKSITDAIKTLLLSLQIPVIKAAMIDADFFVDDQHPARLLLDKLAEAGVGINDHHDPIYKDLETIITTLLKEYDEDIIAFNVALDALNTLTEEIYANAQKKEEESQKQVKYAHARNIVLQEIRKITLGKELPKNVRTLVLKVWPSLMFNHYLRNGKANDEWVEMLMILDKVIESVQPLTTAAEQEELGLTHEDIVNAVESRLEKSRKSQQLIDEVIAGLTSTYIDLMKIQGLPEEPEEVEAEETAEAVEHTVEMEASDESETAESEAAQEVSGETVEVEAEQESEAEEDTVNALDALPDEVQPGAWFIVYNGEDKPVRRLKLAVILTEDATLVFVDHLGNVVIEKTAQEFANEVEKGLSGVIMQHSVFDHALRTALDTIKN